MKKLTIIGLLFLQVSGSFGAEKFGVNAGFGVGSHHYVKGDEGEPKDMTVLMKGTTKYSYVRLNAAQAVLRREKQGEPVEDIYKFGANELIRWPTLTDTYLVDVFENNGKITVLMLLHQSYFYLEVVENYTNAVAPAGDAYLPDQPELLALAWKPLKYGHFRPKNIETIGFQDNISNLTKIELKAGDGIELIFADGSTANYHVSGSEIQLNSTKHEDLDFARKQMLESEFFAKYAAMSDADLKGLIENSTPEGEDLDPEMFAFLDALQDTTKAQALKARINALFPE